MIPSEPDTLDMIRAASWLAQDAREARKGKGRSVCMSPQTAERLADILLAAVNRIVGHPVTETPYRDAPTP